MKTVKMYIRNEKRHPIGVVVAVKANPESETRFGYALCNPSDEFNKKVGTQIAINRALCPKLKVDQFLIPLLPDRRETVAQAYEFLAKELLERLERADG